MMNLLELPPDFIHEPPEGYAYEVKPFKRNVVAIWATASRSLQF